jgi:hypothetical protein
MAILLMSKKGMFVLHFFCENSGCPLGVTQTFSGFKINLRACLATDTMYHILVHSRKSHMTNCPFRFYVTDDYKLFKSPTFLPFYRSLHTYDTSKQLQNAGRTPQWSIQSHSTATTLYLSEAESQNIDASRCSEHFKVTFADKYRGNVTLSHLVKIY